MLIWIGVQFRTFAPWNAATSVTDARGLLYHPLISNRSYPGRQEPPASTTYGRKWQPDDAWDMYPGFFNMPQICDMGPIILLPFRRKACCGFLSPFKNPTASAGFEPANLGIRGQHATSAPPKPLGSQYTITVSRF
jgi:hypothetical protein